MKDISEWLASLGMGDYAQRFAENAIDLSVLRDLTEQDLKDLGVLLGHRRKMLRAIAELDLVALTPAETATEPVPRDEGERRHLTVMFCDLVGSTALSARLDPEDMWRVIASYYACISEVLASYNGTIARYSGDGVLSYFGYPRAQEDDAEQAVRAGLALVDTIPKLRTNAGAALQARIGIATGTVIVSELLIHDTPAEQAIVGETPNLAARLQTLAEPGMVLICPTTRRRTGGHFNYRDLGPVAVKGFVEPVPVWQVLGPSGVESHFEAMHKTKLSPLFGRDEETELPSALLARLDALADRQPVYIIFEDVHWIDPTSLELLATIVERAPQLRVLLLITARPDFTPPWPSYPHTTTIPLTRLGRCDGAALVEQVTGGKTLPTEVMDEILSRTDGVPLFIEELTKTILESPLLQDRDGHYVLEHPLPPLAIPTTLHASLMARLDRLAPVRDVAQIGAVAGREFHYELIHTVAGLPREKLDEALGQLVRSELIFRRGEIPDAVYTFKHALVRDAAYAGLLKAKRAQLHAPLLRPRTSKGSLTSCKLSRKFWHTTSPKPDRSKRRSDTGYRAASTQPCARPISRPSHTCSEGSS